MGKYQVTVDSEGCISCGACEAACPSNFKLGEDTKSYPLKDRIDDVEVVGCKEAEEVCPVDVIKVTEL